MTHSSSSFFAIFFNTPKKVCAKILQCIIYEFVQQLLKRKLVLKKCSSILWALWTSSVMHKSCGIYMARSRLYHTREFHVYIRIDIFIWEVWCVECILTSKLIYKCSIFPSIYCNYTCFSSIKINLHYLASAHRHNFESKYQTFLRKFPYFFGEHYKVWIQDVKHHGDIVHGYRNQYFLAYENRISCSQTMLKKLLSILHKGSCEK